MIEKPSIIKGDIFRDHRGTIRFINGFRFTDIKRFYFIKHPDTSIIRAWQAHKIEKKYFYPVSGSFVVAWVKIDDFENPSDNLISEFHMLSAQKSEIIIIPKGYANGLKAVMPNSELLIFSDTDFSESVREKIRFSSNKWFDWDKLESLHSICA
jgi:dTDP-4-dehydrorhamnose 3,5-epimerase